MHTIRTEASKNVKGGDKMNESQLHEQITEVSKTIFSFCLTKTSNRQDAEDLSQDIILELFKSVKTFVMIRHFTVLCGQLQKMSINSGTRKN